MKELIDHHVHLAAFPTQENGCLMSEKMRTSWLFRLLYRRLGLDPRQPEKSNSLYVEKLAASLRESRRIKQGVILAMDGVYDAQGVLNKEGTEFLIANDYVLKTAAADPGLFLAGISVNPQRRDAIDELERCAAQGAYLVKTLPNAQAFDPANPAYKPFWRKLADLKLPLLSHIGFEFSLIGQDQSVGDPARLRPALDAGVSVIAAHGVSYGLVFYEKYWKTFHELVARYPNFRWDASALSLVNRVGMLLRIRHHPELLARMVFGTDYPLPSLAYPPLLTGNIAGWLELRAIRNPFDRHARLLDLFNAPNS